MNDLQVLQQSMMEATKTPLNSLNSHILSKVISVTGLKERDCICNGGDDVLLLSSNSGLKANRGENVNSK